MVIISNRYTDLIVYIKIMFSTAEHKTITTKKVKKLYCTSLLFFFSFDMRNALIILQDATLKLFNCRP